MKACASFYNPGVGEFRQQPYDNCMYEHDAATQQCSDERRAQGKKAGCLAEPPPAQDLMNAGDAQGADCGPVTKAVEDALQRPPRIVVKRTAAPAGSCSSRTTDFQMTPSAGLR